MQSPAVAEKSDAIPACDYVTLSFELAAATVATATAQHNLGSVAFARSLAIAALDDLHRVVREYLATPHFAAARQHRHKKLGTEPLAQETELARAIRRCRIELRDCDAVPSRMRHALCEALDAFAEWPVAAIRLCAIAAGAREYIRQLAGSTKEAR